DEGPPESPPFGAQPVQPGTAHRRAGAAHPLQGSSRHHGCRYGQPSRPCERLRPVRPRVQRLPQRARMERSGAGMMKPPTDAELTDILRFAGDTRPGVTRLAIEVACSFAGVAPPQEATVPIIRRP